MSDVKAPANDQQITVTLPDGSTRTLTAGATGADLAADIGKRLAKAVIAVKVEGEPTDLDRPLPDGASVNLILPDSEDGLYMLRHSTAHVMAQAVCELWPGARYAIGPPVADGFYYDFELPGGATFAEEDIERIEEKMREIVKERQPFIRDELSIQDGLKLFKDQPFKQEIIEGVDSRDVEIDDGAAGGVVSTYRNTDSFVDLCRGPHVPDTGRLANFKLMRVAAAYWRGDAKRESLQRIYGTAWASKKDLAEHLHRLEEAKKRDHRKLGNDLDLFSFPSELGGGLPVFHPKGGIIRKTMEDYSRVEHERAGYEFVYTPHIVKEALFEKSGHLGWYADGMYPAMEMEGANYRPKPMNCPGHCMIYSARQHSYRELPLRLFELGTVYRFEKSGVLHGLMRARGFTQDDSHIYCRPDQLEDELVSLLAFVIKLLRAFGFEEFEADLSTRPDKFIGRPEQWDAAEAALANAMDVAKVPYKVAKGEGAFYAPKIDIHIKDAIGRRWQVSTLQVDFQEPDRFKLHYIGDDNAHHQPYMIHRALFGSIERFMGILIEHYAGALPTWLSPVQVAICPVADNHGAYALEIEDKLREEGFRVELHAASEGLGGRIRKLKLQKVPHILVVGADDVAAGTVADNTRGAAKPQKGITIASFIEGLRREIDSKSTGMAVNNPEWTEECPQTTEQENGRHVILGQEH